ncbi:chemotaxis protein [Marinimicrobium sp. LS-A18]|uniref:chemotaxis protein n=1 Tax=Marinimicrobium sp. LS-A18 TaxID=1381596 RepID=UPI000467D861|nr:chemotaxis protein [Marinimicrobium sp. LS-A18]
MNGKAQHAQKLLLFKLTPTQSFAMGTLKVREIIPYTRFNRILQEHPAILGATTVRGKTIPVIDMAAAVGYRPLSDEEMRRGSIIITDCQRKDIGFLVRGIDRIVDANWKEVKAPPQMLGKRAFVTGLYMHEDQAVQLIDLELLFAQVYPDPPGRRRAVLTDVQREQLKPLNILLVDDSHVARKQLQDALDGLNIPYQVLTNGEKALQRMRQAAKDNNAIDILVSDIEMPGLDGYELAFSVRDDKALSHAYIILHTSLNSEMSVSYAHQVGANEALTKFDAEELVHAMLRGAKKLTEG